MLCQRCQERPATVHLTKVINFQKTELRLCEVCAKIAGSELGLIFESGFSFQNLIASLLEGLESDVDLYQKEAENSDWEKESQCQNCGLTFSDFKNTGLFGCGDCYSHFKSGLEPLLKKVHGNMRHSGKVPKRTGGLILIKKEIEEMRSELQQAISTENYEKAAELRDEIRRREKELQREV